MQYSGVAYSANLLAYRAFRDQCYGCYRRRWVRWIELLQPGRRKGTQEWHSRVMCGECYAIVTDGEIGIPIPS